MVNEMQRNSRTKPNTLPGAGASRSRRMPGLPFLAAWAVLALLLSSPIPAHPAGPALVSALELNAPGEPQILAVSLSRQPDAVHSFTLGSPARLVLDISPARLPGARRDLPVEHPLIFGIRAAQFSKQTVRVVLDLKRETAHLIAARPVAGAQTQHQILVSLFAPATGTLPPGQPAPLVQPSQTTARQNHSPSPAPEVPLAAAPEQSPAKRIILFGDPQAGDDTPKQDAGSPLGRMEASGFIMAKAAQELKESSGNGQPRMFRNTIRVEGKWTPPASVADPDALRGASNTFLLASVQSDYLWFGPGPSTDDYDLDLYEGYLFRGTPCWDLRLGKQAVRWGKADQISPVDNVNPQDLREFLIPDLEDRKIPNWMARVRLFPGDFTLEGVFVPFFEPDRFDFAGTKWALLGTRPTGLDIRETRPSKNLGHADWGLRTATTVAGWDLAASYLYAWEKSPRLRLDPAGPLGPALLADYHRQHIVGLEFETTLNKFGLRGEGAYFDKQSLHTQTLDSLAKPVAHYVIGVDYLGQQDWYANIQFSHQHVFAYEPGILLHRRDDYFLNGEINREFWRGNFMLKLGWAVDLQDGGSFLTPEAILTYFRNLELSLGVNVFSGPEDPLFGRYRDNDQVFLKAKYFF
ncbi:MAG TPA: AMIN domain-containing protein [Desulfonatronum sp.]|nr:AMIN domain-containing protein [Desulfonatronum sp.]